MSLLLDFSTLANITACFWHIAAELEQFLFWVMTYLGNVPNVLLCWSLSLCEQNNYISFFSALDQNVLPKFNFHKKMKILLKKCTNNCLNIFRFSLVFFPFPNNINILRKFLKQGTNFF